ncbi:MAG TPA: hypothetical protein VG755_34085, partial [Nannocystaceae bacterium]|nr:hypothetical protein [Nannocystaceae bacterium]
MPGEAPPASSRGQGRQPAPARAPSERSGSAPPPPPPQRPAAAVPRRMATPVSFTPEPIDPSALTPPPANPTLMHGISAPVPTPGPRVAAPSNAPTRATGSSVVPTTASGLLRAGLEKICASCGQRFPLDYRVCPRCVIELDHLQNEDLDPLVGSLLAEAYRIVGLIGQGGMGKVYEARHSRLAARRFAVKVMHRELARKAELVTRFRREAELACAAAHPNVV